MAHQRRTFEQSTATDPVCGMTVDPSPTAVSREYDGVTYYFCSAHCVETFDVDPSRYSPA